MLQDLTGKRFGNWLILSYAYSKNKRPYWNCLCDCGTHKAVLGGNLKRGLSWSCGCLSKISNKRLIDLTGKEFGRLTVIARVENSLKFPKKPVWKCICQCGEEVRVLGENLRSGHTKSCGCLHDEGNPKGNPIHGKRHDPVYASWQGMKARCLNQNTYNYKDYGGRGIKVCERWLDFNNFFEDMGDPPPGMTLDRIDVNGDYCPENCRWATLKQQSRNQRRNHFVEYEGQVITVAELAEIKGISRQLLYKRFKAGWTVEKAISTPSLRETCRRAKNTLVEL